MARRPTKRKAPQKRTRPAPTAENIVDEFFRQWPKFHGMDPGTLMYVAYDLVVGHMPSLGDPQLIEQCFQLLLRDPRYEQIYQEHIAVRGASPLPKPLRANPGAYENPSETRYWHAVADAARGVPQSAAERFVRDLDIATWCLRWSHASGQSAYVAPGADVASFVRELGVHVMHQDALQWRQGQRVQPPDGVPRTRALTYEEYWQGVEMIVGVVSARGLPSPEERGEQILRLVQAHPFTPFGRYSGRQTEYTQRAYDVIRHTGHVEALDGYLFQPGMPSAFDELNFELRQTDTPLGMCNVVAQAALIGDVWWRLGSPISRFSPNASCCDEIGVES